MGATTIDPGQQIPVVLSLPMGMHAGMDGPHLFRIGLPLSGSDGSTGKLDMYFKALFK